jgi:hypothetical protein
MPKRITTAATLVLGAAAGVVMALAPIASAEPTPCNPDDVQCQQQQKQPDPAAIVGSATDQANQALNQAPAASPYPTSGPPGGVCARMNGWPIYIPPGGIPSEMASGIPSGPVHAGNCTAKDTFVGVDAAQQGSDAAPQIVGAATPPQDQQQPPPGQ